MLCKMLDIDIWEVVNAAKTKPFGFESFKPGPGVGGHCIPVDPEYLSFKTRQIGKPVRFVELAQEINNSMPAYVVGQISDILNKNGKLLNDLGIKNIAKETDRAMVCGSIGLNTDLKKIFEEFGLKEGANSEPAHYVVEKAFVGRLIQIKAILLVK